MTSWAPSLPPPPVTSTQISSYHRFKIQTIHARDLVLIGWRRKPRRVQSRFIPSSLRWSSNLPQQSSPSLLSLVHRPRFDQSVAARSTLVGLPTFLLIRSMVHPPYLPNWKIRICWSRNPMSTDDGSTRVPPRLLRSKIRLPVNDSQTVQTWIWMIWGMQSRQQKTHSLLTNSQHPPNGNRT